MAWHRSVLGFSRAFADHDLGADEFLALSSNSGPWNSQGAACP
jgi:hypothetical protein